MSDTAAPASGTPFSLEGRSVVLTGACGGIGRAVAHGLHDAGAWVVCCDLPSATASCPDADAERWPRLVHVGQDLGDLAGHDALFERAAALAPLAGLVHAAAVIDRVDIDQVTEESFDRQLDFNVKTTFFLDRSAWRAMRATGGSIVNFTSQGWWTGGYLGSVVYSASKGAVVSLTRGLARSFASDGVRVNAIAPGFIDTPMMHRGVSDEALAASVSQVPLARLGRPDELVGAVLYLISDASSYATGTVLNVSGGQLPY